MRMILFSVILILAGCKSPEKHLVKFKASLWEGDSQKVLDQKQGAITRVEENENGKYRRYLSTQHPSFDRFFCIWEPDFDAEAARLIKNCWCKE